MSTEQRKRDHLRICLDNDVESQKKCFEDVILIHNSLPELSLSEIDTTTTFLEKKFSLPLTIASMTGGTLEAEQINKDLAEVAEKKGIGFSLGSQRAMIENPKLKETYYVRDVAPHIFLFSNIGLYQLKEFGTKKIEDALEYVEADALFVHINPSQELFQKEGDINFNGSLRSLKKLCMELRCPIIGKEVGFGICKEVALKLKEAGVKAIDVGGFGGTNWIVVDGIRSGNNFSSFVNWGIPTPISILECKVGLPLIATGGIRSGIDIARSIVLGADMCGMALPFLRVLKKQGKKGVEEFIDRIEKELKTAMILTGSKNIEELRKAKYILTGEIKDWAEQRKLICR
ncbi:MAG: type 2 isopentenyl-diphosphate Delta-isomerase [Candidatus Aenigmarchaeota archaeon]|nr:type 2 isopentenyl-diphosphate Delta-isomerase [Candidatus Aenigmarchaeota archaeon]